ncbi:hypothetical protein Tco_0523520 [Tanacetum coccineum]
MFWHTARDDTMFTSMRCISIHKDTYVYGTILPRELTNQAMLESKAYQTYYAFTSREKAPKPKYIRKKANSDTSPKKKPVQAAKVAKPEKKKRPAKKTKANVLDVLSETSGTDEGTGTIPGVPDVPPYESKSNKESWGDSQDEDGNNDEDCKSDDHDDDSDDERIESDSDEIPDPNLTNIDDEETMDDQEDDEVIKELYVDVNVNLGNDDTEMIDAGQRASEQQNKANEPVHRSSVSSDFTSKLLNHENLSPADNEIASLMETLARQATVIPEITSGFTTTTPPPTPVSALESEMSEFKQTNQFAEAVSSILGIVDTYLASKMKEAVDVAIQLQTYKLREEAQAENQEFLNQVDSTMKTIIKDQVKAQVSKIMPKIEKYATESLVAEVGRDDQDKDEDPSTGSDRGTKRRKYGKDVEFSKDSRSKEKKSSSTSKDASQSQHKSSGKSSHAEEPSHTVEDSGMQQNQEFVTGDNNEQPADNEVTKADWFKKPERPPILILIGVKDNNIKELEYHLEECSTATTELLDSHNPENKPYPFDLRKPLPLIQDHQGRQIIPKDYSINKDLEYLKGGDLSRRCSTSFKRKRLMRTDELHKFSDGTLNDVRTVLYDIAAGIRMEYLPMWKWSNLDKKSAQVMVQDIEKKLYQRWLMRNLEMLVGERIYEKDLWLLERTI